MKNTPTLSVIIPLYNAGDVFTNCIESLLAQTWTPLEIIIVNDGSTDISANIARVCAQSNTRIFA